MAFVEITRQQFTQDRQGRTFADVTTDSDQPFDAVLAFFNDEQRQRRMEESELHHDRPPLAGVVRELESQPEIDRFFASQVPRGTQRLRQVVGVVVRMIMERRGWRKTGRKGSLGVRTARADADRPASTKEKSAALKNVSQKNTGGLAFWFLRAERYERKDGMPFRSLRGAALEPAAMQMAAPADSESASQAR